jgi:phosphate transport system substrate-binding protein
VQFRRDLRPVLVPLAAGLVAVALVGCGGREREDSNGGGAQAAANSELSGRIEADGSSTVGPLTTAAAERFQEQHPDVNVTVGISGTGGGFERFCNGETDISDASRPIKDDEEAPICKKNGVEYTELRVAVDALTVVVNPENDWVDCVTVEQLEAIWKPGSKVDNWSEVPGGEFPDTSLTLFGAGTDSGTFDYFTDAIVGEEGASRTDYSATEDDNVTVRGVQGDTGALGYFGFSYFEENADTLKALQVDGGDGCVEPSAETAQAGDYQPLARPLFIYVKNEALTRPEVEEFVRFLLEENAEIAEQALLIPLPDDARDEEIAKLDQAAGAGA